MEITEKWLGDIGGWQAMKTARHLADSNAVVNAKAEGEAVRGLVSQGGKRYAAGLAIRSKSDVENLCTWPPAHAAACRYCSVSTSCRPYRSPPHSPGTAASAGEIQRLHSAERPGWLLPGTGRCLSQIRSRER